MSETRNFICENEQLNHLSLLMFAFFKGFRSNQKCKSCENDESQVTLYGCSKLCCLSQGYLNLEFIKTFSRNINRLIFGFVNYRLKVTRQNIKGQKSICPLNDFSKASNLRGIINKQIYNVLYTN